ncbi:MAG: hypothetical protein QM817_33250 [Archangium sp.]
MITSTLISTLLGATLFTVSGSAKTECVLSRWSADFKTSEEVTRWKGPCGYQISPDAKRVFITANNSIVDLETREATEVKKDPLPRYVIFFADNGALRSIGFTDKRDERGFVWKGKVFPVGEVFNGEARLAHVFEWTSGDWKEIETQSIDYAQGGFAEQGMLLHLKSYPDETELPTKRTRVLTPEEAQSLPAFEAGGTYSTKDGVIAFANVAGDFCFTPPPVAAKTKKGWKELVIKAKPGSEDCVQVSRGRGAVLLSTSLARPTLFSTSTGAKLWEASKEILSADVR